MVGDDRGDRAGLYLGAPRCGDPVRPIVLCCPARIRVADQYAACRPSGFGDGVLRRAAASVLFHLDRLVRDVFNLHPRLRLFVYADPRGAAGRDQEFPDPYRRGPMGLDDHRLLCVARPCPAQSANSGVRGAKHPADRLSGAGGAIQRCVAIHLGQTGWQTQNRA